jgi:hypothetical protein
MMPGDINSFPVDQASRHGGGLEALMRSLPTTLRAMLRLVGGNRPSGAGLLSDLLFEPGFTSLGVARTPVRSLSSLGTCFASIRPGVVR